MQRFGGGWTVIKLKALENYLDFYTTALKNYHFKLCYIDAFAGDGSVELKDGITTDGSAVRALKYPFDKYVFFENKPTLLKALKRKIDPLAQNKQVEYHGDDCNTYLVNIHNHKWKEEKWRGVIFLDPFAMDLAWECLTSISATQIFDVWYLFPFSATNRNLYTDGNIPLANRKKLNTILGTENWENEIYSTSPQLTLFGNRLLEKADTDKFRKYILKRLKQTFPTCSDEAPLLRTDETNSPLFLLCFAGSNPSKNARELSLKAADYILSHLQVEQ